MRIKGWHRKSLSAVLVCLSLACVPSAQAASCNSRLGLDLGLVHLTDPSKTYFHTGLEYECRFSPVWGVGGFAAYVFSDPGLALLGAPQLFLHPFGGEFYVSGSPLLQISSGNTHLGMRLASRLSIPVGLFVLVPSLAVDFIGGGQNYWLGLGLRF